MMELDIKTDRLSLGDLLDSDVDVIVKAFNNPKIRKGLFNIPDNFNEMMAHQFIQSQMYTRENNIAYYFAVRLGNELIGCICLYNITKDSAEIGYWIVENQWGNGYATESTKAVVEFAKNDMGITNFIGTTNADNKASQNVLTKVGILYTLINNTNAR